MAFFSSRKQQSTAVINGQSIAVDPRERCCRRRCVRASTFRTAAALAAAARASAGCRTARSRNSRNPDICFRVRKSRRATSSRARACRRTDVNIAVELAEPVIGAPGERQSRRTGAARARHHSPANAVGRAAAVQGGSIRQRQPGGRRQASRAATPSRPRRRQMGRWRFSCARFRWQVLVVGQ